MSEFQYYEFRAVDRALTRAEMAEMREVSSRGEITSSSYSNTYHWGDFKGDPGDWMNRFFDAFIYYANWGTRELSFRLPKAVLSEDLVAQYCNDETLTCRVSGQHIVVNFHSPDEREWENYAYQDIGLSEFMALRQELASGDYRCLYLGWLVANDWESVEYEDEDEELENLEPPVPPGLGELTAAQESFVELFEIDRGLLAAAAMASAPLRQKKASETDFHHWVLGLPATQKDELLVHLLGENGTGPALELRARFERETAPLVPGWAQGKRRTAKELIGLGAEIRDRRKRAKAEAETAERKRYLDDLMARIPEAWAHIESLVELKNVKYYDEAMTLLVPMRDLALRGDLPDWKVRIDEFRLRHRTKRALIDRLQNAGI